MSLLQLLASRPTEATIRAATSLGRRSATVAPTGIVGISDPNAIDIRVIDLCAEVGAEMVRAEFHWSQIETSPDVYNWSPYDAMVARCVAKGVGILGIVTYLPNWLPPDWAVVDQRFVSFATALVKRYATQINFWEVFNEPNLTGYGWLGKPTDPGWSGVKAIDFVGAYTLLLARFNKVVRGNDTSALVVLGGMANHNASTSYASMESYMAEVYRLGAADCFDIFAFHPYGYQNQFAAARQRVNTVMGVNVRPVWFNEYGWTDWRKMDKVAYPTSATNPLIATYENRVHCDAWFHFCMKDYSSKWGTPTFGLCDHNFGKRPGFYTFKGFVK